MKNPYIKYIGRDYLGQRPCQDPAAYYHLLTCTPKPCSPAAKWLRNLVWRFL